MLRGYPILFSLYLGLMGGTLGNDLTALPSHQVQELVDKKRGRQCRHPAPRDCDELPANGASKLPRVPGEGGHDAVQALQAHSVRTGQ